MNTYARWLSLAVIATLAVGCKAPVKDVLDNHFELTHVDVPSDRSFELKFASAATSAICIDVDSWPREDGSFSSDTDAFVLRYGDRSASAMGALRSRYCPGGCGQTRIAAGETVMRSIPYSVFGDQEEIAKHQQKELVITVNPRYCK